MSHPLLSIAIPTLNRVNLLNLTVTALLKQVAPYKEQIEFLILNNASDDSTAQWLNENFTNHSIVKHQNFEERVDIVNSVKRCIEASQGEYIWVFGDDDLPMPGAVHTIIDIILSNKDQFSLLYFNRLVADLNLIKITSIAEQTLYHEPVSFSTSTFIATFRNGPGFITSMIFNNNVWKRGQYFNKDTYYGYNFLGPIYAGSADTTCLYYSYPLIIQRLGNQTWLKQWPLYDLVGMPNLLHDLEKAGITSGALTGWRKSIHLINLLRIVVMAKAFGYKRSDFFWKEASNYQTGLRKTIIYIAKWCLPEFTAKSVYKAFGRKD